MAPHRLRFGIFLAPFHAPGINPTLALQTDLELVQWLDRCGYDEAPIPMEWARLLSSKRFRDDSPHPAEDGRSEFQKDYDRIVFSRAFRRLQGKTQVHPLPDNDHVHTRLTHTLEVARCWSQPWSPSRSEAW